MDASADDPRRYSIRRSPSIGSSAAPVTSGPRAGKRKLSVTTFGSSPSMGPQPPSSPITSELPTDELELKLKHSMHSASQVASTSRSTIDSSDAASDKPLSNAQQTSFPDWQEQRRCHSILAEYDYSPPTEDRRDPRSSNSRLVMSVSSPQPQVMVTSVAHDRKENDAIHSSALQPPPIPLHGDAGTESAAHLSTLASGPSSRERQATEPHAVELESSLSQSSNSVPPSPEGGVSPSPSFSEFKYQRQLPHHFSSSIRQLRPNTAEHTASRNSDASSLDGPAPSTQTMPSRYPRYPLAEPANNVAASTSTSAHLSLTAAPSRLEKPKQRERSSLASSEYQHDALRAAASRSSFQLQPVPPAKRRRFDDVSSSSAEHMCHALQRIDETRRSSDAGIAADQKQGYARLPSSEHPQTLHTRSIPQGSSKEAGVGYSPAHIGSAAAAATSAVLAAPASDLGTHVAAGPQKPEASASAGQGGVDRQGGRAISNAPAAPAMAQPRKQHVTFPRRTPRLVRAQSVPNLRAKATLDITAPSHHRLVLPSHWASYVSSHARQGREGSNNASKGFQARSTKGFPFNVAHYPVGTSSSRSRSTFTPTLHPPITRHTLRELDLFEILKNPQLRHDVVFDPNVQFRPNFDGERGRRKREAGERYWTAVVREIETGCTCTAFSHGQLLACTCKAKDRLCKMDAKAGQSTVTSLQQSRIPSRIPLLVQELRTICLSILPSNYPADAVIGDVDEAATACTTEENKADNAADSDGTGSSASSKKAALSAFCGSSLTTTHHQLISQTLDPHLISQELQHGVLDVPALITFMGSILKLHCAPMRDEAIERMVEVVCVDRNIGKGLRLCFEILELMKLDIANHQLRSARPFLVETAVDFEIRWFKEQIEQGKMSLDRTNAWMQQALSTSSQSNNGPRSETVMAAFNQGMLQLIFDVPGSLPLVSPVATPLGSPSSSSLNNTFASHYPETFQFDAYRMMTFHNDVSDLTIVYMLVLLFRQLCSTPLNDGGALPASVGTIVQKQLRAIKGEIWCLVNDANLCLSSSGTLPMTPTAASGAPSPTRRTAAGDGKLFLGSAGGFAKLAHPRWRRAMQNVLLQVAARAAAVQTAARAGSSDPSTVKAAAPSAATQKLLNSWMETNLRTGSALHKICQSRLRDVVLGLLGDKVRAGLQSSSSTSIVPCAAVAASTAEAEVERPNQKRAVPVETQEELAPSKKLKSDATSATMTTTSTEVPAASPWDTAMTRAGLEPFAAEIRLLSERIAKVATFHLRVFRNLYQGIESGRHKSVGGAQ